MRISDWSSDVCSSISITTRSIAQFDLDITTEPVMLQAIVGQHQIAAGSNQRTRGAHAVTIDPHRHPAALRDQHRFVAAGVRIAVGEIGSASWRERVCPYV